MSRMWVGGVVALAVFFTGQLALAEKRIALVIGNSNYTIAPLSNPRNDAKLMAHTLRRLNFDVIEIINASQKDMKKGIRYFGKKLDAAGKDGVGLFFYAGHGVQVQGANYLIPVDAEIETEGDVDIEAINAQSVLSMMEFSGARLNFVIMDACRNNPYQRSFRSATRGLAKMEAPTGSLIAYATAPGEVAADGTGRNSPYTTALAKGMLSGKPVERMFREVRNEVMRVTKNKQTPWESSSLTGGDFYFNSSSPKPTSPGAVAAPVLVPTPSIDKEALFWESIKDEKSISDYEAYLEQYPGGAFASLARRRLDAFRKQSQPSGPSIAAIRAEERVREELRLEQQRRQDREQAQERRSLFDTLMAEGDEAMGRYQKTASVDKFSRALKLYPGNEKTKERLKRAKKLVDPCMGIVGEWAHNFVVGTSDVTFSADGTMYSRFWLGNVRGRWKCLDHEKRKINFRWDHGFVETVTLSLSANEYKGKSDTNGIEIHGLRKGSPELKARQRTEEKKEKAEMEQIR